jgi:N-acetylmuramoyl-L-alanine amidase
MHLIDFGEGGKHTVEWRWKVRLWIPAGALVFVSAVLLVVALWGPYARFVSVFGSSSIQEPKVPAEASIKPLEGPWVVAVQPGHWEIDRLPQELAHRRGSTGALYGSVREVDVNRAVVDALIPKLEAEGWTVILVPATVPPGLRADAFISIHADGSDRSDRRGWKLSPPWRASPAARSLAAALSRSFAAEPDLVEDKDGVTIYMRGYYSFNYRRYHHAISPYTPSVLIELGFITNPQDRELLTGRPDFWADLVVHGMKTYFEGRDRSTVDDLRPLELPLMAAGSGGAVVRRSPRDSGERMVSLGPGTVLRPVDESGDWYEVFLRQYRRTGWVAKSELVAISERR